MNTKWFKALTGPAQRQPARLLAWLRDPGEPHGERASATLIVFIMFFPLIVGGFGFGVDVTRNIWIRNSIQNAVDSAVVGGAGTTKIASNGTVVVDSANAAGEMRKLYAINREDNPNLVCIGDHTPVLANGTTYPRCWKESPAAVVTTTTTQFSVKEQSKNAFMGLLGMPTQDYSLRGKAKIIRVTG